MNIVVNTTRRQVVTLKEEQVREPLVEYLRNRGHVLEGEPIMRVTIEDCTLGPSYGRALVTFLQSVQLTCEVQA